MFADMIQVMHLVMRQAYEQLIGHKILGIIQVACKDDALDENLVLLVVIIFYQRQNCIDQYY